MKLSSFVVLRPFCVFVVLSFIALLLPGLLIPFWISKVNRIQSEANLITRNVHQGLLSSLEKTAMLLSPMNLSAMNLARLLSSSMDKSELPFQAIGAEVAPVLFQALSTIPHLSQVSYIALDGLFFSYYTKGDQTFAVYSNTSFSNIPHASTNCTWYTRPVNRDTGKLYGEAMQSCPSSVINAGWFQEALKSKNGSASIGIGWDNDQDLLVLNSVSINRRRALSLGFPAKSLTDFFTSVSAFRGGLYLATNDGTVLNQGIPNTRMVLVGNSVSFQLLKPNGDQVGQVGNITCPPNDVMLRASILEIWKMKYLMYCSPLQIVGLQSVYVLALPYEGPESFMHQNIKFAISLLIIMITAMVVSIFTFIFLTVRAARREMHLCAALIKQMEETQQAERKSMNKNLAFASANHDVRSSLAGIIGLIEMCHEEATPGSDIETNLVQAQACTEDLLGVLNSILDASKIEAGKMQLEKEEFDLEQLLEDVVDLYHPVGLKKGVDVLLDPYDGTIKKCSLVKGDRGKLKQILCNLLSNAVKFTSEGHVSVRVWARKPSFENEILASSRNKSVRCMSCFYFEDDRTYRDLEVLNNVQKDENLVEFTFEVNDTGKGIPKEMRKRIFENYVQIEEATPGQEGTGLGLGIVQSLVRLMGGEIAIVDKEIGEKGSCFRFNTFLSACGTDNSVHGDIESHGSYLSSDSYQHSGPSTRTHSPKAKGSQVILFIKGEERRRISQKFMESLGIKVSVVKQYEQLHHTLKKIKKMLIHSRQYSSSGKSDLNSRGERLSTPPLSSGNPSSRPKEVPLSALDGRDHYIRSSQIKNTSNFVLIVIDTSAGPFREISRAVAEFRRDLFNTCNRVVWIDRPGAPSINVQGLDEDKLPSMDLIISKPLHGSRLYQVIGLLPEFGGTLMAVPRKKEETAYQGKSFVPAESSNKASKAHQQYRRTGENQPTHEGEIQEIDGPNKTSPLTGKKVLVAEDNPVLRKLAMTIVSRLGADVYPCQNGEEALGIVCRNLSDQRKHGTLQILPIDYILMDCEMPVMDGYETTRRIREEEKHYGVHIPIIALTAHAVEEETSKMIEAGMDSHLSKPLRQEQLLEVIVTIHRK